MLSVNDFQTAAGRLKNVIHTIPLSSSKTFSEMSGAEVYLKYETSRKPALLRCAVHTTRS